MALLKRKYDSKGIVNNNSQMVCCQTGNWIKWWASLLTRICVAGSWCNHRIQGIKKQSTFAFFWIFFYSNDVVEISPSLQDLWGQYGTHMGPTGPRWAPMLAAWILLSGLVSFRHDFISWNAQIKNSCHSFPDLRNEYTGPINVGYIGRQMIAHCFVDSSLCDNGSSKTFYHHHYHHQQQHSHHKHQHHEYSSQIYWQITFYILL